MTGSEHVLIEDWCQQYPSHSIGSLAFGPDGALYVSGGDGASFDFADYGQDGNPLNPCGDPPAGVSGVEAPPSAEGGALRSQDLRTSTDPAGLNGAILRVDRDTGAALPDNPLAGSADPNARRIIAYGLRNPFRFTVRPGTSELWVGDVGWGDWEELDRVVSPTDSVVENFGWPCYEGGGRQPGYDGANLDICETLYAQAGAVTDPYYTYQHSSQVIAGESCPTGSSSVSGLAFQSLSGDPYPPEYDGALFFADHSRNCIWAMERSGGALPNPSNIKTFVAGAANPVDLQIGPGGDLYYVDFDGGTVRRIEFTAGEQPPTAVATATPTSGAAPLTVSFDGSGSSDPDAGDTLSYAWDLDGDGAYDDSSSPNPTHTYTTAGSYTAGLKVRDSHGASGTASVAINVGNTPPTATITSPAATRTWAVGDPIEFAGSATDAQDGPLPASALQWELILHHCPSNCHTHSVQSWDGVGSGSFDAPDHEYPSYLELRLTATDPGGLADTKSVRLDPRTVNLTLESSPSGLQLVLNGGSALTPFTRTVIEGSTNSLSAPSPQTRSRSALYFTSWSDGGAQSHNITASATAAYTAKYSAANKPPTAVATTTPTSGDAPLTVSFDGTRSSDPDPADILTYAWDLDGDGAYDDSSSPNPTHTYTTAGSYTAGLKVRDSHGASGTASVAINVGNTALTATIVAPLPTRPAVVRLLELKAKPLRRGVRFSFRLSKAATIRVSLSLRAKVRRRVKRHVHAGRRSITVRRLPPGRYRATLVATDPAGNKSQPVRARFRVRGR
jgi:PKD repeat protein